MKKPNLSEVEEITTHSTSTAMEEETTLASLAQDLNGGSFSKLLENTSSTSRTIRLLMSKVVKIQKVKLSGFGESITVRIRNGLSFIWKIRNQILLQPTVASILINHSILFQECQ
jgi:hypothetical protein